jgi:hypothetical protein
MMENIPHTITKRYIPLSSDARESASEGNRNDKREREMGLRIFPRSGRKL